MKTKLEVLYAHPAYLHDGINHASDESTARCPVVRYSDACAAISALEADIELKEALLKNAKHRFDEMAKQLERMALLCDSLLEKPAPVRGRWDGPAKVL